MAAKKPIYIRLAVKADSPHPLGLEELAQLSKLVKECVEGCSRSITKDAVSVSCPLGDMKYESIGIGFNVVADQQPRSLCRKIEDLFVNTLTPTTGHQRQIKRFDTQARDSFLKLAKFARPFSLFVREHPVDSQLEARFKEVAESFYRSIGSLRGTLEQIRAQNKFYFYVKPDTQAVEVRCEPKEQSIQDELSRLHKKRVEVRGEKTILKSSHEIQSMVVTELTEVKPREKGKHHPFLDLIGKVEGIEEEIRALEESRNAWRK